MGALIASRQAVRGDAVEARAGLRLDNGWRAVGRDDNWTSTRRAPADGVRVFNRSFKTGLLVLALIGRLLSKAGLVGRMGFGGGSFGSASRKSERNPNDDVSHVSLLPRGTVLA